MAVHLPYAGQNFVAASCSTPPSVAEHSVLHPAISSGAPRADVCNRADWNQTNSQTKELLEKVSKLTHGGQGQILPQLLTSVEHDCTSEKWFLYDSFFLLRTIEQPCLQFSPHLLSVEGVWMAVGNNSSSALPLLKSGLLSNKLSHTQA